ncbi:MAG: tyrosine-type recombinase/integrase [Candidatus Ancillula sp.]|jgi:site-specific recombinase XerD|nr:tyrosine-type recombinase/integrase [Candidatus Ancillula sp.]
MEIKDAIRVFTENLKIRGYSVNTLRSYAGALEHFDTFLFEVEVAIIKDVDLEILRVYITKLVSLEVKKTTIHHRVSVLKAFFSFLHQNDYISKNPSARLRYPKTEKKLPHILSTEQMDKILNLAMHDVEYAKMNNTKMYETALRNYTLFELLYSSGLRIFEAVSLNVDDLDFEENQLCVVGKGNKSRVVPFNGTARKALLELVHQRNNSGALFMHNKGARLKVRDAYRIIQKLAKSADIDNVHPHMIRHTMATHMIDNSADIRIVQEILGHSSIATTQKYIHVSSRRLQAVYLQAFPRA